MLTVNMLAYVYMLHEACTIMLKHTHAVFSSLLASLLKTLQYTYMIIHLALGLT